MLVDGDNSFDQVDVLLRLAAVYIQWHIFEQPLGVQNLVQHPDVDDELVALLFCHVFQVVLVLKVLDLFLLPRHLLGIHPLSQKHHVFLLQVQSTGV